MTEICVQLSPETEKKIGEIAKDCNLPLGGICEIILSEFAKINGGCIHVGKGKGDYDLIYVIQWPFLNGLIKCKREKRGEIDVLQI